MYDIACYLGVRVGALAIKRGGRKPLQTYRVA